MNGDPRLFPVASGYPVLLFRKFSRSQDAPRAVVGAASVSPGEADAPSSEMPRIREGEESSGATRHARAARRTTSPTPSPAPRPRVSSGEPVGRDTPTSPADG